MFPKVRVLSSWNLLWPLMKTEFFMSLLSRITRNIMIIEEKYDGHGGAVGAEREALMYKPEKPADPQPLEQGDGCSLGGLPHKDTAETKSLSEASGSVQRRSHSKLRGTAAAPSLLGAHTPRGASGCAGFEHLTDDGAKDWDGTCLQKKRAVQRNSHHYYRRTVVGKIKVFKKNIKTPAPSGSQGFLCRCRLSQGHSL